MFTLPLLGLWSSFLFSCLRKGPIGSPNTGIVASCVPDPQVSHGSFYSNPLLSHSLVSVSRAHDCSNVVLRSFSSDHFHRTLIPWARQNSLTCLCISKLLDLWAWDLLSSWFVLMNLNHHILVHIVLWNCLYLSQINVLWNMGHCSLHAGLCFRNLLHGWYTGDDGFFSFLTSLFSVCEKVQHSHLRFSLRV